MQSVRKKCLIIKNPIQVGERGGEGTDCRSTYVDRYKAISQNIQEAIFFNNQT